MDQLQLEIDGFCCGPLFAPVAKARPLVRPKGKEGIVHRAQQRQRTPAWCDLVACDRFYVAARHLTRTTGELHVVDHIVPKCGPTVSGLHVPNNLQVLHWRVNASKSNAWWPDMWGEQVPLDAGS